MGSGAIGFRAEKFCLLEIFFSIVKRQKSRLRASEVSSGDQNGNVIHQQSDL